MLAVLLTEIALLARTSEQIPLLENDSIEYRVLSFFPGQVLGTYPMYHFATELGSTASAISYVASAYT